MFAGLCAVASDVKHHYQFVYERKSWPEALSYCRDKYIDLATIEDFKDVQMLNSKVDLSKMSTVGYSNVNYFSGFFCDSRTLGFCTLFEFYGTELYLNYICLKDHFSFLTVAKCSHGVI